MTTIPTSADYLNRVISDSLKTTRELRYDSAIALTIGVSKSTLSQYRTGKNMSVYVAIKFAFLLDLDPMETITATMYHQAQAEHEKAFWASCYEAYRSKE